MKFRFGQSPFQTEQEPVIKVRWVIASILVENERASQRTQLDQPVPVGGVPGQARDLQSHHQACIAEGDLTDQLLKPITAGRLRARLAEIAVEYVDTFEWPAQRHCTIAQGILALRARSEEHTSELQSRGHLVCRLLLEKKKRTLTSSKRFTLTLRPPSF